MSDFGSLLTIHKANNEDLSDMEKSSIIETLQSCESFIEFSEVAEITSPELREWDAKVYAIILTEYYMDDDYEENFEFAQEEEQDDVSKIATQLQEKMGEGFNVESGFVNW